MNIESLETLWNRQTLAGPVPATAPLLQALKRDVAAAQRRIRGVVAIAVGLLMLEWLMAVAAHVTGIKTLNALQTIGHLVSSALYVALALRARQSLRAIRQENQMFGGTTRDSVAATLRVIELQIGNVRVAALAIPLVVAGCAWLFAAKYWAGDMPGFGAVIASGFVGMIGAVIGAAVWHRYRTRLAPRREELRATLREIEER